MEVNALKTLIISIYDTQAQDGVPLPKLNLVDARRAIGFVQQEPILFDRTIGENIAYGNNEARVSSDEVIEAAKQANIHNFITSLPLVSARILYIIIYVIMIFMMEEKDLSGWYFESQTPTAFFFFILPTEENFPKL